jgi:hypothetical protein
VAQLFDLAFELGDRPFEIEEVAQRRSGNLGSRRSNVNAACAAILAPWA